MVDIIASLPSNVLKRSSEGSLPMKAHAEVTFICNFECTRLPSFLKLTFLLDLALPDETKAVF